MAEIEELYTLYSRRLYRFLLALTGNPSVAEELTQQTFYKAFLHINQYEGRSGPYTWLCQIAKNTWYTECKKSQRFTDVCVEDFASADCIDDEVIWRDETRRLACTLRELPSPHRDVLILRIYGELPFAEIAALFEKSESWAKVTFFRGKERLRRRMEEQK